MITFAANNGGLGGGEVMLLRLAEAVRELGLPAQVVAPPGELAEAATAEGFPTEVIPSRNRLQYISGLRRWAKQQPYGLLWCNGLVPAFATTGLARRIVHLHQPPRRSQVAAAKLARVGAVATVVPSQFMANELPGSFVLPNWCAAPSNFADGPKNQRPNCDGGRVRIGFLGRMSRLKGVDVLANAITQLLAEGRDVELVLAGAPLYVRTSDARPVTRAIAALGPRAVDLGWTSREEFFAQVDIAVFPSRMLEAFGLVVTEAMASGVPFVVSDAGALPEIAGPAHRRISRAGDVADLAATLASAIDELPDTEGSAVAQSRWQTHYSPSAGLRGVAHLLSQLNVQGELHKPAPASTPISDRTKRLDLLTSGHSPSPDSRTHSERTP